MSRPKPPRRPGATPADLAGKEALIAEIERRLAAIRRSQAPGANPADAR